MGTDPGPAGTSSDTAEVDPRTYAWCLRQLDAP